MIVIENLHEKNRVMASDGSFSKVITLAQYFDNLGL